MSNDKKEKIVLDDEQSEESQSTDLCKSCETLKCDIKKIEQELNNKASKCEEYFDLLQRSAAEFDNYKKRVIRERQNVYCETTAQVIASFLPVLDNLERALESSDGEQAGPLKEGLDMVLRQLNEIFSGYNVEEIDCLGEEFNPEYHNAVMHVDDDSYGENEIIEVLQKGYILDGKVLRHSVVKVAN